MREVARAAAVIVIVVGLAAGASLWLGGRSETVAPGPDESIGHVRGIPNAPITLAEYGDYECPPCATYEPIVQKLLAKYSDTVKFEFRHMPLTGPHPNALKAAMAAEAAGEQDKYWEMHDLLMTSQGSWGRTLDVMPAFLGLARQAGLDVAAFETSMQSSELEQRILKLGARARAMGVAGTPTFLINGNKLESAPANFEGWDALIAEELRMLKLGVRGLK